MNARPITTVSSSSNDIEAVTHNHNLLRRMLASMEPKLSMPPVVDVEAKVGVGGLGLEVADPHVLR